MERRSTRSTSAASANLGSPPRPTQSKASRTPRTPRTPSKGPGTPGGSSAASSTSSRPGLPQFVLKALAIDIIRAGGIHKFQKPGEKTLQKLCDQKPLVYGKLGNPRRLQISNKVDKWKQHTKDQWFARVEKKYKIVVTDDQKETFSLGVPSVNQEPDIEFEEDWENLEDHPSGVPSEINTAIKKPSSAPKTSGSRVKPRPMPVKQSSLSSIPAIPSLHSRKAVTSPTLVPRTQAVKGKPIATNRMQHEDMSTRYCKCCCMPNSVDVANITTQFIFVFWYSYAGD